MSLVIGLTGPTGAGKSSVTAIAEHMGFKVINCDNLARKATQKGSEGLLAVVSVFGKDILNADDTLNRTILAKKAFGSKENTELLNTTLLPHIVKLIKQEITAPLVLLDAPTLFESGADSMCDTTIAVLCDVNIRKKRIIARDGLDSKSADLRIRAGKSDEFYIQKAQNIVYNNCELPIFEAEIQNLLNNIMEEHKNV